MGKKRQIETCFEHFTCRLKEGWRCISLSYPFVLLASGNATQILNLRNDVETLRPNAVGDHTGLTRYGGFYDDENYKCVDEVSPDESATFVDSQYDETTYRYDLYNLPAHSGSGAINSVTIHARCRKTEDEGYLKITCKTHSTVYYGSEETLGTGYVNYSKQYTTNPNTSNAWTWTEIDALQIGVSLKHVISGPPGPRQGTRCTQVYVVVNYSPITPLAGVVSGSSTVTGSLGIPRPLAGEAPAVSSLSGTLNVLKHLSGIIAAPSSVTGVLSKSKALVGVINAVSTVQAARTLLLENGNNTLLEIGDYLLLEAQGNLTCSWVLKSSIDASTSVTGALSIQKHLTGEATATASITGSLDIIKPLAGVVAATTTVSGAFYNIKCLAGLIGDPGCILLENGDNLLLEMGDNLLLEGSKTASTLTGNLCFVSATQGFYYAKLGTDNLNNPQKANFSITTELNNIASFDYVIQNDTTNRDIIANNLTDDFNIMRDDGTELLRGSIDSDSIEYFAEGEGGAGKRIRLSGFANFVDLKYLIYKRMADADAEDVGSVQDEDNSTSTFIDYTTAANNATINDVLLTFGAVDDALYIGKDETFFAVKIKYSTKGVQAANTTIVMEYSKGSGVWATLDCIDESYSFTEDAGTYLLYIPNKADDWAKDTINGKNQYHIRFRLTEGSYSTLPKLDQIKLSNADVCRVQFNETDADIILGYLLEGTDYTEDATDQCPSTKITIRGEYDSILRWIFGLGKATTWEDGNGDKQRYDCWIDTAKKVHYKQHRGTDQGDISAKFRALTNKIGYGEMGTRIFSTGGQEGINQKRAIVEDLTAQGEHQLREIVLEDNKITTYEPLKEEALKSLANRKDPLKDVSGNLDTKYWLDTSMDVGDKITVHQPDWNLNNQELYVMRAVIGPSVTNLDLGNSQVHLEHMQSTLQRQMDVDNVWMHGSVSTYVVGPEEDNYERKDDTTAYPLRFTIEVPDNARGINHVEIGWELMSYKSSVGATGGGGGHSHTTGPSGGGGAHDHPIGATGGEGGHDHTIVIDGLHYHDILGTIAFAKTQGGTYSLTNWQTSEESPGTGGGSAHTHSNPSTGGPSSTFTAVTGLTYGDSCAVSGYCVTGTNTNNAASSSHTHTQGITGDESSHTHTVDRHRHSISYELLQFLTDISFSQQVWTTVLDEGHSHGESIEPNHAHTNPNTSTEPVHAHTIPESSTEPVHEHNIVYSVHEILGGTTLELYVGDELVGDTYVGDQSGINITGWITTGHNTITLKPIVGDNVKGRAKMSAIATVFLENLK